MRSIQTALVLVLAAALLAPAAPAAAATPTCDGKTATIVGKQDALVSGTEGADVIVSNGAQSVYGYGGNDRICMTGKPSRSWIGVYGGYGHDRVFIRTAVRRTVNANLGPGNDLYIGGPGKDVVHAGMSRISTNADDGPKDAGFDRIATGPGADHVTIGQPDLQTRDVVRLGRHSDRLTVFGTAADGHVFEGNAGVDFLHQTWERHEDIPDQSFKLNNTSQVATIGGEPVMRWDSFQHFKVRHHPAGVFFSGSNRPESIESLDLQGASMGGNDDLMLVQRANRIRGTLRGGRGQDSIVAYGPVEGSITGDLNTDRIDFEGTGPDERADMPFAGIVNLRLLGDDVRLIGDDRPNQLDGYGCNVTISGRGGDDTLLSSRYHPYDFGSSCGLLTMVGGNGHDRLTGGVGADELYGGRGRDFADGQAGSDLCRAEQRRSCER